MQEVEETSLLENQSGKEEPQVCSVAQTYLSKRKSICKKKTCAESKRNFLTNYHNICFGTRYANLKKNPFNIS